MTFILLLIYDTLHTYLYLFSYFNTLWSCALLVMENGHYYLIHEISEGGVYVAFLCSVCCLNELVFLVELHWLQIFRL